ncbi:MAG: DNA helicase II / ATP-dependent DNA helicase PcrA [Candidatus Berkelbacteria bacterium Gr01-1014_85]|uniref:DNA 3'-5' helicase n=1 Tax=Candidatus Berkelbacteria bacterium Gr01-1014_85 TaxID=2017150 RepID=A0A554JCB5_9BACT|nr:MAG: DNA helicase II / ATP-dependent DNA helicase PcrA [Candidatus Berkelbacteria bacterium Gr01-1014_85]
MEFLKELNSAQYQAATSQPGPILLLAGAGSGKTKTLTARIAYLIEHDRLSPWQILAVTFTNKAAREMRERLELTLQSDQQLPWLGTFHRVCLMILRRELPALAEGRGDNPIHLYSRQFSIYDEDDATSVIKRILLELQLDPKKISPKTVKNLIDSAKNELMSPDRYQSYAAGYLAETVARVYRRYHELMIKANAMDFDDIIMQTVRLFEKNPELLDKYQTQFKAILVDEYQDTNHAQYTLIKTLAARHQHLFVVGDDYQSIYSWRGADFRNILRFEEDYPSAQVYKLEENYRSTQNILDAARAIITNNQLRTEKKLWTSRGEGALLTVVNCQDDRDEADFVVREIQSLLASGYASEEIAVLYRLNSQSRSLEEQLIRQGQPYRLVGAIRFYERKEIKDALAWLKYLTNPSDLVALSRIINLPPRGIGDKTLEKVIQAIIAEPNPALLTTHSDIPDKAQAFFQLVNQLQPKLLELSPAELINTVLSQSGYLEYIVDGTPQGESRAENIQELLAIAGQFETLDAFLGEIMLLTDADNLDPAGEASKVTLMTLHAAKGLEFRVVFILGLEEGVFPHSRSLNDQTELEEERRLCYVGITRAKEKLYLTNSRSRLSYLGIVSNPPSRFLSEIPEHLIENI